MTDTEHVLSEFIRAWEAGRLPDAEDYLERVAPEQRDELAAEMTTYLMLAPEPEYGGAAWEQLRADPAAARIAARPFGEPEAWPSLLPRLRERAGVTWRQAAERLGVSKPERAEDFLERMERGELDPNRVSPTLLARLGRVLGVSAGTLAWRGTAGSAAPALYRQGSEAPSPDHLAVLADLAMTPAAEWDDVDELFLGGRDQPGGG
jgi:transcriptional regulator with XRE-family HTH domain